MQVETSSQSDAVERFARDNGIEVLPLLDIRTDIVGQSVRLFGVRVGQTQAYSEGPNAALSSLLVGIVCISHQK